MDSERNLNINDGVLPRDAVGAPAVAEDVKNWVNFLNQQEAGSKRHAEEIMLFEGVPSYLIQADATHTSQ